MSFITKIAKDIFQGKEKSPKALVKAANLIIEQIVEQIERTQKEQQEAQIHNLQGDRIQTTIEAQQQEDEINGGGNELISSDTIAVSEGDEGYETASATVESVSTTTTTYRKSTPAMTEATSMPDLKQHNSVAMTTTQTTLTNSLEGNKLLNKYCAELSNILARIKAILYGTQQSEPKTAEVEIVVTESIRIQLIDKLVVELPHFPFEARKDASQILCNILKVKLDEKYPVMLYFKENEGLLAAMIDGYARANLALLYGPILRECASYSDLHTMLLFSEKLYDLMSYLDVDNFEVASDAFKTLKALIRGHKRMAADFMLNHFDTFFKSYNQLMQSSNYVTRLQSLKLLSDMLQDRANFKIMKKYIGKENNLRIVMTLLLSKSKLIQYQTFQVFKVFVANPKKSDEIRAILHYNRDRLIAYLESFLKDNSEELFLKEKQHIIENLKKL